MFGRKTLLVLLATVAVIGAFAAAGYARPNHIGTQRNGEIPVAAMVPQVPLTTIKTGCQIRPVNDARGHTHYLAINCGDN